MTNLIYEKTLNEQDPLRKIVKIHTIDCILGTSREDLDYVDVLYPAIEGLFGVDACISALENKDSLKVAFLENFNSDISYEELCFYFNEAIKTCDEVKDKDKNLEVYNCMVELCSKLYEKKNKTKTK